MRQIGDHARLAWETGGASSTATDADRTWRTAGRCAPDRSIDRCGQASGSGRLEDGVDVPGIPAGHEHEPV